MTWRQFTQALSYFGIVTLIEGGGSADYRASAIPHVEGVSPKPLELGSIELMTLEVEGIV